MINIIEDNYAEAFALESYLIEEAQLQHKVLSYVNECVCLESGDYSGIRAINESLADSVKNVFGRLIEFFKKAFNKFRERLGELFTTDKTFLQKYKEIILKREWKNRTVSGVYKYSAGNLNKLATLNIDFNAQKGKIKEITDTNKEYDEEAFVKDILSPTDSGIKSTEVAEFISISVKGEDTEDDVNIFQFDKKALYDFCVGFEKTNAQLEKNQNQINKNQTEILTAINKLEAESAKNAKNLEAKKNESPSPQQQPQNQAYSQSTDSSTGGSSQSTQTNTEVDNASSIYSNVLGRYIHEGISASKPDEGSTGGTGKATGPGTSAVGAQNMTNINAAKEDIQNRSLNKTDADAAKSENKKLNREITGYQNFFKYTIAIQTNLMTVGMAMYKDYMKLLRIHVRDYVGTEKGATSGEGGDRTSTGDNSKQGNGNSEAFDTSNAKTLSGKEHGTLHQNNPKYRDAYDNVSNNGGEQTITLDNGYTYYIQAVQGGNPRVYYKKIKK